MTTTTINLPSWFKYTFDDFTNKNIEVWFHIKNELKFDEIIDLYASCKSCKEITDSLIEILYEEFPKYEDDINNFVGTDKHYLLSFDKETNEIITGSIKRNNLSQVVKEDFKTFNEVEESLKNCIEVCKKVEINLEGIIDFEFFALAKKLGELWIEEKKIFDCGDLCSGDTNKIMNFFPKTFEYVVKHKLGWDLGGWSGGYK